MEMPLTYNRKVPNLNLGRDNVFLADIFEVSFSISTQKFAYYINQSTTSSFRIRFNGVFTYERTIRRYVV
jgi:hypothetical protein